MKTLLILSIVLGTTVLNAAPLKSVHKDVKDVRSSEVSNKPANESLKDFEKRVGTQSSRNKSFSEIRLDQVIDKSGAKISYTIKRDLVEGLNLSLEMRQVLGTIDSIVRSKIKDGGRLSRADIELVEISLEWLSKGKNEGNVNDLHMVFEDALKNGYAEQVALVLKEALRLYETQTISIYGATNRVLQKRGISEKDVLSCKKG